MPGHTRDPWGLLLHLLTLASLAGAVALVLWVMQKPTDKGGDGVPSAASGGDGSDPPVKDAPPVPEAKVPRLPRAPTLDGKRETSAWARAEKLSSLVRYDAEKTEPETLGWLGYDDEALYLAVQCADPDMASLRTNVKPRAERDGEEPTASNLLRDDSLEVFLDVRPDNATYHQFITNAAEARWEARFEKQGSTVEWPAPDSASDGAWTVAARKGEDRWHVEMRLPWSMFDLEAPPLERVLRFNLVRNWPGQDTERGVLSQWSPTMAENNHRVSRFGKLRLIASEP